MSIEVGSIVEGTVTGITNFGAFVELPESKVGLIHISEVSDVYVRDVREFLKERDKVTVKVLSIDAGGKIGLSIKQLKPPTEKPAAPAGYTENRPPRPVSRPQNRPPMKSQGPVTFEDKMKKFLNESDDRLTDLKRSTESKRGGRGSGRRSG